MYVWDEGISVKAIERNFRLGFLDSGGKGVVAFSCLSCCVSSEFESLSRLGIPDPVNYIKKRFKDRKLLFLQSVCVDVTILDQLEASVEEAVNSETWIDLQVQKNSKLLTASMTSQ